VHTLALPTQIEKATRRGAMDEPAAKSRETWIGTLFDIQRKLEMLDPLSLQDPGVDFALRVLEAKSQRVVHRSAGLHTIVN
jgi:hypothetical protein